MSKDRYNLTPPPANLPPAEADRWRVYGSHRMPGGECCHCGPSNHLSGPQFACDCPRPEEDT